MQFLLKLHQLEGKDLVLSGFLWAMGGVLGLESEGRLRCLEPAFSEE